MWSPLRPCAFGVVCVQVKAVKSRESNSESTHRVSVDDLEVALQELADKGQLDSPFGRQLEVLLETVPVSRAGNLLEGLALRNPDAAEFAVRALSRFYGMSPPATMRAFDSIVQSGLSDAALEEIEATVVGGQLYAVTDGVHLLAQVAIARNRARSERNSARN